MLPFVPFHVTGSSSVLNPGVVTAATLMAPHAIAAAAWIRHSGRLNRRAGAAAAAAGLSITALPLAMRIRMRRAADRT